MQDTRDSVHPGFEAGAELALATTRNYRVLATLALDCQLRPGVQAGCGVEARFGPRYTTGVGLFFESYLAVGARSTLHMNSRVRFGSPEPERDTRVEVSLGLAPAAGVGLGYDFGRRTRLPIAVYVRPSLQLVYPDDNGAFATSYSLGIGLLWSPRF